MTSGNEEFINTILNQPTEKRLDVNIKLMIKEFVDTLQDEFKTIIDNPECTEEDALKYILLFDIYGLLSASMLDVTMEEYYAVVDYMIPKLGIEVKYDV